MTALPLSPTARPRSAALRLHRPALIVWGVFQLLAAGGLLWVHLFRAPAAREDHSASYFVLTDVNNVMNFLGEVLSYVSIAVAAWAGAALIGRELEDGTARLAWTQSVTPARWLTAKLTAAALPLVACPPPCWGSSSPGSGPPARTSWSPTGPGTASSSRPARSPSPWSSSPSPPAPSPELPSAARCPRSRWRPG